jgi:hypothetical protein
MTPQGRVALPGVLSPMWVMPAALNTVGTRLRAILAKLGIQSRLGRLGIGSGQDIRYCHVVY